MEDLPGFTSAEERERLAQMEAQLDWHHRADAGLSRLKKRLRQDGKSRLLPFVRRFTAVAALLLVTLSLTSRLDSPGGQRPEIVHGVFAALVPGREGQNAEHALPRMALNDKAIPLRVDLPVSSVPLHLGEGGRLPEGPRVNLMLEVRNESRKTIALDVGGARTLLRLDLRGPGVKTLFGKADDPPFLVPIEVVLAPGASYFVPIPRLIGGRHGGWHGVYWTRPGRYTLSVHYRVGVKEERRDLYVSSPPLTIDVSER